MKTFVTLAVYPLPRENFNKEKVMEKENRKKRSTFFLAALIITCCALIASVFAACKPDEPEPTPQPQSGDEVGTYYFDDDQNREFLLTLSEGLQFTFVTDTDVKNGSYSLANGTLTLTDEDWSQTATYSNEVITMSYNNVSMRFLRKTYYSVEFNTDGGSSVAAEKVLNGKTIEKPESDPIKPGYVFLGWYTDRNYTTPYIFGAQPVSDNVTIYARWAAQSIDGVEYTISYDLGYAGAEIADATTIGGKLYNSAVPTREGYSFGGWWISMENEAGRLTYRFEEPAANGTGGTVFTADTTLFAVWNADDSDYEADVPAVNVTAQSISWEPNGAARYNVKVTAPDGTSAYDQSTSSTTVAITFSQTGAYKVEVTSLNAGGTQISETAVRYYVNNGLDRVTGLKVIEPGILVYNAVPNADKYLITIDCGNDKHNHTSFDNGKSLYYNFSNCDMQKGGIVFTVEAVSKNYASSKATIAYERNLEKAEDIKVTNDLVTWTAVDGANYYIIKIGDKTYNVFGTEYSLKQLAAGKYNISVKPVAKGFNSPDEAALSYDKTTAALPADIRLADTTLSWTAAEDGATYQILVNDKTLNVPAGQLYYDLTDNLTWTDGAEYSLQLKVTKGSATALSDAFSFVYNALEPTLTYEGGILSWKAVASATSYEVQLNGETIATVTDGSNYVKINSLGNEGLNTLRVCFIGNGGRSDWATTEVYAHAITFNSDGKTETLYKAIGDEIVPPEAAAVSGYDFDAWYNTPNGPESNGAKFDSPFFTESSELVLYAYYTPKAYTVQFLEAEGLTNGTVYYGENFKFEVPVTDDVTTTFGGWYSAPYGAGIAYTDANGNSLAPWNIAQDGIKVYAFWVNQVLTYTAIGSNYAVSQGARINLVESVTIPEKYNNISITSLTSNAFANCTTIKEINIPDTMQNIPASAFEGCTSLEAINVYSTGAALPRYSSQDGVLFDSGDAAARHALRPAVVPAAKTGTFTIPAGVDIIPASAFAGSKIEKVVIPSSVTTIEREAFADCTSLASVVFENLGASGTLAIGDRAFLNCEQLEAITLPARLTEISLQKYDELRADNFESLDDLTEQAADAFLGCDNLASVNIAKSSTSVFKSEDGVLIKDNTIVYFPAGKSVENYTFPATVTAIGEGAFLRTTTSAGSITGAVNIPARIKTIGAFAFTGCNISSLTFGGGNYALENVTIGDYAFYGSGIETITFEENSKVVSIGESAFEGCSDLESVTIPASVTSVGDKAFKDSGLINVTFVGDATKATTLMLGSALFSGCSLSSLSLSANANVAADFLSGAKANKVTVAEGNDYIAAEGSGLYLKSASGELETFLLYVPSDENDETEFQFAYYDDNGNIETETDGSAKIINIRNIAASAFAGNENLKKVVIPASVITIGDEAFSGALITTVEFAAGGTEALDIGTRAFYEMCGEVYDYDEYDYVDVGLTAINLPDRPVTIGDYAFANNELVQEITLGGTTYIGDYAFSNTGDRKSEISVELPKELEVIGNYAFEGSYSGRIYGVTFEELGENEEYALKTIGAYAFTESYITSFNVPASVESIGAYAFYDCGELASLTFDEGTAPLEFGTAYDGKTGNVIRSTYITSINLPGRLTVLSDNAFYYCYYLETITFGNQYAEGNFTESKLTTIGNSAFADSAITEITLPASVTTIGDNAFESVEFTTLTIPANVTSIGAEAFKYSYIESITFENGTSPLSIGDNAFNSCSYLEAVAFPSNLAFLGVNVFQEEGYSAASSLTSITVADGCAAYSSYDGALYTADYEELLFCPINKESITINANTLRIASQALGASKITSVTFEENSKLKEICDEAFYACSNLESIVIPDSVTTLGNHIFIRCNKLTSITLPASLANFTSAMLGCSNLQSLNIGTASGAVYKSVDGVLFTADGKTLVYYLPTDTRTNYEIPAGTETINESAFSGNTNLESVKIPASVNLIDTNAFNGCTSLSKVEFTGTSSEALVIGKAAFNGCSSLASITLPARTSAIEENAFYGARSLSNITFGNAGETSQLSSIGTSAFYRTGFIRFTVPEGVRTLGDSVFGGCPNLQTVTLSEGLISMGNTVFSGSTALDTVSFPASLQTIGTGLFNNCSSLRHVNFATGSQIKTIPADTFRGCTALESITLPASLTAIAGREEDNSSSYGLFQGLTNLTSVTFEEGSKCLEIGLSAFEDSGITNFTIPSSVTTIRDRAFYGTALKDIVIPRTISRLDGFSFANCQQLETVTIEAELTEILDSTFENCTSLSSINIPASVEYIAETAFSNCGNLMTVALDSNNESFVLDNNGALFNAAKTQMYIIPTGLETFEIPASLTGTAFIDILGNCLTLETVTVEDGNAQYVAANGVLYDKNWNIAFIPSGMTEYVLPAQIATLSEDARDFILEHSNITSISIEGTNANYVEKFGVLYDNEWNIVLIPSGMTEYTVPAEVTNIDVAKLTDSSIQTVSVEEGNTAYTVSNGILYNKDLTEIVLIPSGVKTFIVSATTTSDSFLEKLESATGLEEIVVEEGNTVFQAKFGALYDMDWNLLFVPRGMKTFTIPVEVTLLDDYYVFEDTSIETVVSEEGAGETLTLEGGSYGVFYYAENLKTVTLPSQRGVIIGYKAFYNCDIETLTFFDTVESVGEDAFRNWSSDQTIVMPFDPDNVPDSWDSWWKFACNATFVNSSENA